MEGSGPKGLPLPRKLSAYASNAATKSKWARDKSCRGTPKA